MTASGQAITVARRRDRGCVAKRAWNLEGGQVNKVIGRAPILDRTHYVRTIKTFATARIIPLKVVIEVKRLSILQRNGAVDPPRIFQLREPPAMLGQLVAKVPTEAPPDVEIGIAGRPSPCPESSRGRFVPTGYPPPVGQTPDSSTPGSRARSCDLLRRFSFQGE